MRTINCKYIIFVLFALGINTACTQDEIEPQKLPEGKYPANFIAEIGSPIITRTSSESTWEPGDMVDVKIGKASWTKYTIFNGALIPAVGSLSCYWQYQSEIKTVSARFPSGTDKMWAVQVDQSGENFQKSDFLYAPAIDISFEERDTKVLPFYHLTSKVIVHLLAGEGVDAADLSNASVTILNTRVEGSLDLTANGSLTAIASKLVKQIISHKSVDEFTALLIPQDVSTKEFIRIAVGGQTYTFIPKLDEANLKGGFSYVYDVTLNKNGIEVSIPNPTGIVWGAGSTGNGVADRIFKAGELKVGDYYYKDGTHSDGGARRMTNAGIITESENITAITSKECTGIVFYMEESLTGVTIAHVISAKDAVGTCQWSSRDMEIGTKAIDYLTDFGGYQNALTIGTYIADATHSVTGADFPAYTKAANYGSVIEGVNGWYLPSAGELLKAKKNNLVVANLAKLVAIGKADAISKSYWSSTEVNGNPVSEAYILYGSSIMENGKTTFSYVRPVLSFK
ncbi:MAG: fimbrillin family protein [Bacteroidaceae bacterium]